MLKVAQPILVKQVQMDCAVSTAIDMDHVLLQIVLQHQHSISVRQLFRLGCVSKLWYAILKRPNISTLLPNTLDGRKLGRLDEQYWFIMAAPHPILNIYHTTSDHIKWDFMAFSTADNTFFRPPPLILSHIQHTGATAEYDGHNYNSFLPRMSNKDRYQPYMLSSDGLMAVLLQKPSSSSSSSVEGNNDYQVMVFNCLTRSVKLLPSPLNPSHLFRLRRGNYLRACNFYMSTRIHHHQQQLTYYVMLTNLDYTGYVFPPAFEDEDPYVEVYDSSICNWKVASQFRSLLSEPSSEIVDKELPLLWECDFFFMYYDGGSVNAVLGYHVAKDLWIKVNLQLNDESMTDNRSKSYTWLVKCNGRLLGCSWLQASQQPQEEEEAIQSSHRQCCGFVVNELEFVQGSARSAKWVEVSRTPEHLQQRRSSHGWYPRIRAEGKLIYMTFQAASPGNSESGNLTSQPPLVYDVDGNHWFNLPRSDISTHFGCVAVLRPWMSLFLPHLV